MKKRVVVIRGLDVAHKTVLVRIDLNSDIHNKRVMVSPRLLAPLDTINYLRKRKARVVLLAHQGRPGSWDYTSLEQHYQLLKKHIKLSFVKDVIGVKAQRAIAGLQDGEVLLLDNVRSIKDEFEPEKKNNILVKVLLPLIDCYVNDAFSVSHRAQTSIVSFAKHVPSAAGLLMQREIEGARKLDIKNALLVLGGSKPEDNLVLAKKLKNNTLLANGLFGPYCWSVQGENFGKETKILGQSLNNVHDKDLNFKRIVLPKDFAISRKGKRVEVGLGDLPIKEEIFDLGSDTIAQFSQEILQAKTVFFKGLSGLCNTDDFSIGTRVLLKALEYSKAYSVVCGGHTSTMIDRFKIDKRKLGHISLAGGALVQYLAGEKLPGLEALTS